MPALLRGHAPFGCAAARRCSRAAPRAPCAPPRAMQTVQLGASELHVSRMGLGTMTFGARAPCARLAEQAHAAARFRRGSDKAVCVCLGAGERNTYDEAAHLLSMAGACCSRARDSRGLQLRTHTVMAAQSSSRSLTSAAVHTHTPARAVDGGVTLLDSAEMYPVPQRAETQVRAGGACAARGSANLVALVSPRVLRSRRAPGAV
jgi:hypothetical protein